MTAVALAAFLLAQDPPSILDQLESRARTARTLHAEFDLERLPQYSAIVVDFDPAERRLSWLLTRGPGLPADHYLIDQFRRYRWTDGRTGDMTSFEPYWSGFERGFNSILLSLLPDRAVAAGATPPSWGFGIGINLEGKPSRDGKGSLQFYGTFYRVPFRWLGVLREEEERPGLVMNDQTCTFLIPSRKKTVLIDRNTGFLRSIETVDYDGTVRSVACRAVSINEPLAPFPKPPECREIPVTPQELDEILESRRHLFHDLLSAVLEQWDKVVESGRQGAVGKAYAQEISDLTATWWEARLHQIAAAGIRRRLDSGNLWQSLKEGEDREIRAFVDAVRDQSRIDRVLLKASLEDFEKSLEALYLKKAPPGSDPAEFRKLLHSSLQFDDVWRIQVAGSEGKPADVFREELQRARRI
jgi:hypothetical protein